MNGDGETIRLFRFTPVRGAFDSILRDVMIPDLWRLPGVRDVYVGRHGPEETGPRLVASIWESSEAMEAAVGTSFDSPAFHPEYLAETTDRRLDFLPVSFAYRAATTGTASIIRLVDGQVRAGELDAYIAEAWAGTEDDAAAGRGPDALYLAAAPPDRFRTLSVWPDWETLQDATGGDIDRPIATRHAKRLVSWGATHYEALPDVAFVPEAAETAPAR
jgi:hypothetical protein